MLALAIFIVSITTLIIIAIDTLKTISASD